MTEQQISPRQQLAIATENGLLVAAANEHLKNRVVELNIRNQELVAEVQRLTALVPQEDEDSDENPSTA